jgi:hypothetical protein
MTTPKLLFHPRITLAATIGAVTTMGAACSSFVVVLNPLKIFTTIAPFVTRIDGDLVGTGIVLGVVAAGLTVVAGLGRSFSPLIDGTQPVYH